MRELPSSYLSPKLRALDVQKKGRYGIFAVKPIAAGELIVAWGGTVFEGGAFRQLSTELMSLSVQIEDDLFLTPDRLGPGDRVNHSCEPNAGVRGYSMLVAMQDIQADEEVCYDYAMTDGSPYDEFTCACGAPTCRHQVTGQDWKQPELQQKYAGYFSLYLQCRITQLKPS